MPRMDAFSVELIVWVLAEGEANNASSTTDEY